eukprot:4053617-Lingulodinium_polyedra.AAC.1
MKQLFACGHKGRKDVKGQVNYLLKEKSKETRAVKLAESKARKERGDAQAQAAAAQVAQPAAE